MHRHVGHWALLCAVLTVVAGCVQIPAGRIVNVPPGGGGTGNMPGFDEPVFASGQYPLNLSNGQDVKMCAMWSNRSAQTIYVQVTHTIRTNGTVTYETTSPVDTLPADALGSDCTQPFTANSAHAYHWTAVVRYGARPDQLTETETLQRDICWAWSACIVTQPAEPW